MKEETKVTGIELRDYFAGIAMGALIQLDPNPYDTFKEKRDSNVKKAYRYADAMLAEREESEQA
jgi:hypothetical protein